MAKCQRKNLLSFACSFVINYFSTVELIGGKGKHFPTYVAKYKKRYTNKKYKASEITFRYITSAYTTIILLKHLLVSNCNMVVFKFIKLWSTFFNY